MSRDMLSTKPFPSHVSFMEVYSKNLVPELMAYITIILRKKSFGVPLSKVVFQIAPLSQKMTLK
jgi:hypothetical protein